MIPKISNDMLDARGRITVDEIDVAGKVIRAGIKVYPIDAREGLSLDPPTMRLPGETQAVKSAEPVRTSDADRYKDMKVGDLRKHATESGLEDINDQSKKSDVITALLEAEIKPPAVTV